MYLRTWFANHNGETENVSPVSNLGGTTMGQMKHGTLPTPHETEGCYLRMRVDSRVVNIGKVHSEAADVTPSNVTPLLTNCKGTWRQVRSMRVRRGPPQNASVWPRRLCKPAGTRCIYVCENDKTAHHNPWRHDLPARLRGTFSTNNYPM